MDDKVRLEQIKEQLFQRLAESGEKDRFKERLKQLLDESGWRDEVTAHCREVIQSKGAGKVTVDELIPEITAFGRQRVPDEVKKELLQDIRQYLVEQSKGK